MQNSLEIWEICKIYCYWKPRIFYSDNDKVRRTLLLRSVATVHMHVHLLTIQYLYYKLLITLVTKRYHNNIVNK